MKEMDMSCPGGEKKSMKMKEEKGGKEGKEQERKGLKRIGER